VIFPSSDEPSEVVHPCKEPLHFPSSSIAAELASVLCSSLSPASVRRDQLDAVLILERLIERVRVVGFVADEPGREFVEKTSGKNLFHKLALGRRSALDRYGERKTVTSGDSDDLGALAATGGPTAKPLFSRSRRLHRRTPHPGSACPAHTDAAPEASAPPPASRCESTAGTGDGRSGMVDISPATRATALRCPTPRALRLAPRECHATDDRGYPHAAPRAAPVPTLPTVHRSTPTSCHPRLRRNSELLQNALSPPLRCL
jgi:hypothetical protein